MVAEVQTSSLDKKAFPAHFPALDVYSSHNSKGVVMAGLIAVITDGLGSTRLDIYDSETIRLLPRRDG